MKTTVILLGTWTACWAVMMMQKAPEVKYETIEYKAGTVIRRGL